MPRFSEEVASSSSSFGGRRIASLGTAIVAALLLITFLGGSWYTVDQGYRGVVLRNGALVGTVNPGLGFKVPLVDSVIKISVQEHSRKYEGPEEKGLSAYSYDIQAADIRLSVNYTIPEGRVDEVYTKFSNEEGLVTRILDPKVYKTVKDTFGQYTAARAIQDRAKLGFDMLTNLQAAVGNEPLVITSVQIENIDFSTAYEQSIEQRMQAEIEVQKLKQNAEREKVQAQIRVTQATAQADAVRIQAQADSDASRLRGEGEAAAIKAKADALASNSNLISLTQAEKWDGKLPTTMVPGGTVPFLNMQHN